MTRLAKLNQESAERTTGELQAALAALTNRVEALEAARAHGVSRQPASAQTDPKDLSLRVYTATLLVLLNKICRAAVQRFAAVPVAADTFHV